LSKAVHEPRLELGFSSALQLQDRLGYDVGFRALLRKKWMARNYEPDIPRDGVNYDAWIRTRVSVSARYKYRNIPFPTKIGYMDTFI
jgi:hypothetical protein